jgi:hypothetical protein
VSAGHPEELARAMILQAEGPAPTATEQFEAHSRIQAQSSLPVQATRMGNLYRRLMAGHRDLR